MGEALSIHADEIFQSFTNDRQRSLAALMFKALTVRESEKRGIRRPQRLGRLAEIVGVPLAELLPIVEAYRAHGVTFLMPPPEVDLHESTIIDISHESLMRVWVRLRDWVEEEAQSVSIFHRLAESAALHEKGKAGLYRDPELGIALAWRTETKLGAAWAEQYGGGFDPAMAFLDRSREASEREEKEREANRQRELERARQFAEAQAKVARLFKRFAGSLVVGLCCAVALTIWALKLRQAARINQKQAEGEKQRAEKSEGSVRQVIYAANVNLVQSSFEQYNFVSAKKLLEETSTNSSRGFEWYYWQRQLHREARILRGHVGVVNVVVFSPDNRRVATGGADGMVKIWETVSGKELLSFPSARGQVQTLAFSPDGERILSNTDFPPSGGGGGQATLYISSATTGKLLLVLKGACGSFSPDGRRVATVVQGQTVIWDSFTGDQLFSIDASDPPTRVKSVYYSPDGRWLISNDGIIGGATHGVKLWDAATGQEKLDIRHGSGAWVEAIISPDNQRIARIEQFGSVTLWDATTGKRLGIPRTAPIWMFSAAFSPDSRRVIGGCADGSARIWDTTTLEEVGALRGHTSFIQDAVYSPDGRWIATASNDGTARIWETAKQEETLTMQSTGSWELRGDISPDGRWIVTTYIDGKEATIWEAATGKKLRTLSSENGDQLRLAAFSPDGSRVAAAGYDTGELFVWDATTGQQLLSMAGEGTRVAPVVFSRDGKRIATAAWSGQVTVWDTATGKPLLSLDHRQRPNPHGMNGVAFSPDNKLIVTGSADGTAKVWDAITGEELHTFHGILSGDHQAGGIGDHQVSFPPDGRLIVSGGSDWAKVWDVTNGQLLFTLSGHREAVRSVKFSPDGKRILTGSGDGTAKLWDVASHRELMTFKAGTHVAGAYFFPDGHRILTTTADGNVRIWEAATPQEVAAWEQEEKIGLERVAALERERKKDPFASLEKVGEMEEQLDDDSRGAIREWLALAPIPFAGDIHAAADKEQLPREASLRPKEGDRAAVGKADRTWKTVRQEEDEIDFEKLAGPETENTVAYAVAYVLSDTAQTAQMLKFGSRGVSKVFLNGEPVREPAPNPIPSGWNPEHQRASVELKAGLNVVLLKVASAEGNWKGKIWLKDTAGKPLKGIKVTLDPEGKK